MEKVKDDSYDDQPAVVQEQENEDDLLLLKLGYKSVLARGWGAFDNFACTFSALNCIGVIRVLFYIALSGGGPAAMYVRLLILYHAIIPCADRQKDLCGNMGKLTLWLGGAPGCRAVSFH